MGHVVTIPDVGDYIEDCDGDYGTVVTFSDYRNETQVADPKRLNIDIDELLVWVTWDTDKHSDPLYSIIGQTRSIHVEGIRAIVCRNCLLPYDDHAADGKCLYSPTHLKRKP